MTYDTLLYDIEDGICTITLNRPESLNALNGTMLNELPLACEQAAADNDVRVVILTGAGRLFCAGGDLKDTGPRRYPQPRAEHLLADESGAHVDPAAPDAEADDRGDQRRCGRCRLLDHAGLRPALYVDHGLSLHRLPQGRLLRRFRRDLDAASTGRHGQGA